MLDYSNGISTGWRVAGQVCIGIWREESGVI